MDPLKAVAATLFCLVLFWLVLRLTQRLMAMAIAAGHAEEQRRAEAEAMQAEEGQHPQAAGIPPGHGRPPPPHAAGAVP